MSHRHHKTTQRNNLSLSIVFLLTGIIWFASLSFALPRICAATNSCVPTLSPVPPTTSPVTPTAVITVQPTLAPSPTIQASSSATTVTTANGTAGSGTPGGTGSSNQTPGIASCPPGSGIIPPVLTSITAGQSGELTVNWTEADTSINHFSLIYGLVGNAMNWGLDFIPNTARSYTILGLPSGSYINAQIWAWKDGCAGKSLIVDPLVN